MIPVMTHCTFAMYTTVRRDAPLWCVMTHCTFAMYTTVRRDAPQWCVMTYCTFSMYTMVRRDAPLWCVMTYCTFLSAFLFLIYRTKVRSKRTFRVRSNATPSSFARTRF